MCLWWNTELSLVLSSCLQRFSSHLGYGGNDTKALVVNAGSGVGASAKDMPLSLRGKLGIAALPSECFLGKRRQLGFTPECRGEVLSLLWLSHVLVLQCQLTQPRVH